jgi:DNA-binding HxlR family transcriptional regulator
MGKNMICPRFQKAIGILSKRWNALIINQLLSGPQRFCTINASMPISGRLLSERLKELELEGIVSREVFPEVPVRVEYTLTEKGHALKNVLLEIAAWSKEWIETDQQDLKEDDQI